MRSGSKFFIIPVVFFAFAFLCGCAWPREMTLVDSAGRPIPRGYVFARQENILYPNSSGLFVADENGTIRISWHGMVRFYAGKEGFLISSFALAREERVRVVIYSLADKIPRKSRTGFGELPEEIINIDKTSPEAEKWVKYVAATPIIDVSENLIRDEDSQYKK